ncbi:uncharacterized protein F4822DRAFT_173575 [Hypoxylon trugodes]|uniref:uncharacterized protein n=1 Tax=Hypoxylon trugodes TaxID=326681 RepID=UPI00219FCBB2|nr:uncharacterized protein F4822DRAFT_173575 [Hypoxylon trugodes]KAI1391100.1 hypothetical protein F4822DRAFT_173575 [Hypoxylon trugodes]
MTDSNTDEAYEESYEALQNEISDLELRLQRAKKRLTKSQPATKQNGTSSSSIPSTPSAQSAHHYLLLLSDSALPLGSFAFSSGLESYLAHTRRRGPSPSASSSSFSSFLPLSLSSYASTTLPFALAAHRNPSSENAANLDDELDAAIVCRVGRRASVAQGRALLAIWEKSIASSLSSQTPSSTLKTYSDLLRSTSSTSKGSDTKGLPPPVSAHLPPLFGAISSLCGLTAHQAAYIFMLNHAKALVSAAVRAGLFGPYQAQRVLAGQEVQTYITAVVDREWDTRVEDAGQNVPVMDFWVGRHELLYSRIFNS